MVRTVISVLLTTGIWPVTWDVHFVTVILLAQLILSVISWMASAVVLRDVVDQLVQTVKTCFMEILWTSVWPVTVTLKALHPVSVTAALVNVNVWKV